jgi:hypothetical protein
MNNLLTRVPMRRAASASPVLNRAGATTTTSINAPLRQFEGDHFVVGIAFLSTTFEVSTPPHQEAGTWKMVVDGVELTRTH